MSIAAERPASRVGKKAVTFWIEPTTKRRFDQLCLDNDISCQDIMEQALDLLFEHYLPGPFGQTAATDDAFWGQIRTAFERKYAKK